MSGSQWWLHGRTTWLILIHTVKKTAVSLSSDATVPRVNVLKGLSMADVRLELAKEEMQEANGGHMQLHETSPNIFLQIGLELEDQQ